MTAAATKHLVRIGPAAKRIRAKIDQYAADPDSLRNNVKALKGRNDFRLRVGDYRVIFEIDGDIMVVIAVATRGEVYG